MERTILVLTQTLGKNYGGILQAYALQKVLKELGYRVITLNQQLPKTSLPNELQLIAKRWVHKYVLQKTDAPHVLDSYYENRNEDNITSNTRKFIHDSMETYSFVGSELSYESLSHLSFDTVIVGSDQVWRPIYSLNIRNYFLDFLLEQKDILKLSYAASFGTEMWEYSEELTQEVTELTHQFHWVSVREQSGVALCRNHLNINADWVLDPTLLLSKSDYCSLLGNEKTFAKRGVCTYLLDASIKKDELVNYYALQLNTQSYSVYPIKRMSYKNRNNLSECQLPSVEHWLKGFREADFVVTDSFHGTIFALLFQIPFVCIVNSKRGASRMVSLLQKFELSDRLVFSDTMEIKSITMDFSKTEELLQKYKADSLSLLKKHLTTSF